MLFFSRLIRRLRAANLHSFLVALYFLADQGKLFQIVDPASNSSEIISFSKKNKQKCTGRKKRD
ncbi:Uncharacterized protein APZ42_022546 [Daphnia magna]|uniref:Uncharacterized protein n=1 Tax=Daphnia magna TaxID=35525 RepID=A0A164VK45_9CRUS|nr:Uncharacterized protein APZ42_022546 [Daphnia magna]